MTEARRSSVTGIVVVTFCALIVLFQMRITDEFAANRDFVEYWAAGQQLVRHANPYDPGAILRIEQQAGMRKKDPQITFSPPAALCMLAPLGLVSVRSGFILWLSALIVSLSISIWLIWTMQGRPQNALHMCGYLFAPAIACFLLGQIGAFLLLGISLFLFLHSRHPFLAGAALLPCVWKPHLFLPFFIVLFLWSLSRKRYLTLVGFSATLLASCVLTLYFDPQVWSHYSQMMAGTTGVLRGYVPTLSVTLRFLVARQVIWLQYIPEIIACVWAVWYFWTRRNRWNWVDQGSWVLLVSSACTPYGWFTDEAVLLPAVLVGGYRAVDRGRSLIPIAVVAAIALVEVTAFRHIDSTHYLWTVPAWLGWYAYATRNGGERTELVSENSARPAEDAI